MLQYQRTRYAEDPEYRQRQLEHSRAYIKRIGKEARKQIADRCLSKAKATAYAQLGSVCTCCGESDIDFLSVDHVDNDGYKDLAKSGHRKAGLKVYAAVIKAGIFQKKYQLLCYNCNMGKAYAGKGVCPHKKKPLLLGLSEAMLYA